MHSDEKTQEKGQKFIATISSGKLMLEINDHITYKGQMEIPPFCDAIELKGTFERGEMQILTKTTSKLVVKLGFFKIELLSEDNHEIKALKARIEELEQKLVSQWEEENLDSKDNFDTNYIYRVTANGFHAISTAVSTNILWLSMGGGSYNISPGNRRTCSAGWAVTKIQRKKL